MAQKAKDKEPSTNNHNETEHFVETIDKLKSAESTKQLALIEKVTVLASGQLQIKKEDMPDFFKSFSSRYWQKRIVTTGLVGNRNALTQKFSVYNSYMTAGALGQDDFWYKAKLLGYNNETITEMWSDFENIFFKEFIADLKEQLIPMKKEDSGVVVLG